MIHYDIPLITGSVENQLKQLKSFLFQQTEKLNYNLDMTTPERFWQATADAIANADNEQESDVYRSSYTSLKSLIIKSATEVMKTEETFSYMLSGQYLTKSEFGSYFEKATVDIKGTPYGITQLYEYAATISTDLDTAKNEFGKDITNLEKTDETLAGRINGVSNNFNEYKIKTSHYIKDGYLDTTTSEPIFGVEIGLLESKITVDGKEISNSVPKKLRITPDRMSIYSGSNEVAYIEETAIYFPNAHITGGTLNIGSGTFTVDNKGNMTATSGYIGGWKILSTRLENDCIALNEDGSYKEGYRSGMQCVDNDKSAAFYAGCMSKTGIADAKFSKFFVTQGGKLFASEAEISGKITAKSGTIANFEIADIDTSPSNGFWVNSLSCVNKNPDNDDYYAVFLRNAGAHNTAAFGVKKCTKTSKPISTDWGDAEYLFYVTNNGLLMSKNANITGNITATSLTLSGNVTIPYTKVSGTPDLTIYIKKDGTIGTVKNGSTGIKISSAGLLQASNAVIYGTLYASAGEIGGWTIDSNGIVSTSSSNYTVRICNYNNTNDGSRIFHCHDNTTDTDTFSVTRAGKLFANNAEIEGKITATSGSFTSQSGDYKIYAANGRVWFYYSNVNTGRIGGKTTQVFQIHAFYNMEFNIGSGLYDFRINSKSMLTMTDTIFSAPTLTFHGKSYANDSDIRLKENVKLIDERYEKFFYLLQSKSFKYKHDAKEIRLGFIAQDIKSSLEKCSLEKEDFAGLIEYDRENVKTYALDYTQFVALNTHMIQKCMKKISALEAEILTLKSERN